MFYIGSCAKSGTHYTTEFLNRLNINVQHEYPGKDGIVTWYIYHTPANYPHELNINFDDYICLHQVREPLSTITSLMMLDIESWRYIRRAMNMNLNEPLLLRCMKYYYYWHKSLKNCTFTFQVEDILELIPILDLYKINYNKNNIQYALETPRLGQTLGIKPNLNWKDLYLTNPLLSKKIFIMAKRYDYEKYYNLKNLESADIFI